MDKSASLVRMRSCPGKRLTLSSRTGDRRHWCGVCPAGAIRSPRPALARALSARSCWAAFVCISFPLRGSGKRNQGVRQMCARAHAHATGMCGHDSNLPGAQKSGYPFGYPLFWSCWADSNCRPHPYQGCALPPELQQHWRPRRDSNPRPLA